MPKLPALLLLLALGAAPAAAAAQCRPPDGAGALRAGVVAEVNAARRQAGLPALGHSRALEGAAQALACDNAGRGRLSHRDASGAALAPRLGRAGYRYRAAAENIGYGPDAAPAVVRLWMGSAGHRRNILDGRLQEAGVGVARGPDGRPYWALVMGSPR